MRALGLGASFFAKIILNVCQTSYFIGSFPQAAKGVEHVEKSMKGDVGMSPHKKEREQLMMYYSRY